MDIASVTQKVADLVAPIVAEEGLELLDVVWTFENGRNVLRLVLDKEGGTVGLADCQRVSHAVEDIIEVENIVPARYDLEVSSPGINRSLKQKKHFEQVVGKVIRVKTRVPLNNRQNYKGLLKSVNETELVVEIDRKDFVIPLGQIEKANLEFEG
ncbi:MAG: ribosome maturation factor RimP [Deltaproteobacteria bacterium]|nr:ribosome maturation factor RimP [Deltaproteobacteria bacterium]